MSFWFDNFFQELCANFDQERRLITSSQKEFFMCKLSHLGKQNKLLSSSGKKCDKDMKKLSEK